MARASRPCTRSGAAVYFNAESADPKADSYSSGWQARALSGSVQQNYKVMPANYTLMAIPLAAGEHRLILEYKPLAFLIGKWLSLFSLMIYIIALICYLRKRYKYQRGNGQ